MKFLLYFFGKLIAAAAVLGVAWIAFNTALNTSNVNVMVKDAFAKRASVILNPLENSDTALLSKIFTNEYLIRTGLDTQTDNKYYLVTLYSQRTDVETKLIFPGTQTAEIEVKDVLEDVRATLVNEDAADFVPKQSLIGSGVYKVTVVKTEAGWMINDISLKEEVIPEDVRPLPTPAAVQASSEEDAL